MDKVLIVTGASRGIGAMTARLAASRTTGKIVQWRRKSWRISWLKVEPRLPWLPMSRAKLM